MHKITLFILLSLLSLNLFSQKWKLTRYEAMIGIGPANYFGDIGGAASQQNWYGIKDISPLSTRPSVTLGIRYKIKYNFNVRLSLTGLMLSGSDAGSVNDTRGFKFNSYGIEHMLVGEFALFAEDVRQRSFAVYNRRGMLNNFSRKSVYLFGGLGGAAMFPDFQGSPTRHDKIENSFVYSVIVPVGIGVKMIYNNKYAFSVEFGGRYSLSDYIDGVTSSFSKFNDIYYFTSFNLVYRIKTSRKGYPILFKSYYGY